jgi:ADP-ribosylglycohydrolase
MSKQSIYNMLASKAEPVKVEFALIDDIKAETAEASKGAIRAIDLVNKARNPAQEAKTKSLKLLLKIQRTIVSAKELGANDAVKTLEQSEKQVLENIKTIENVIAVIEQI